MKVVLISNFNIENIAESLLAEELDAIQAEIVANEWNDKNSSQHSIYYAVVKPDDYRLWRGMADLI